MPLIKRRSVKSLKPTGISRELRRCPVKKYTNSCLMQFIHKLLKILRSSESGSRSIISVSGISARNVIQIFHDRVKLHMSEIFLCQKFHQFFCGFPLFQRSFINGNRLFSVVKSGAFLHPVRIIPCKAAHISHNGCTFRIMFCRISIWICFQKNFPAFYLDFIFIVCPCFHSRKKQFKNTGHRHTVHDRRTSDPSVKITHNIYTDGIRCPDSKQSTFYSSDLHRMCTQFFVCFIINTGTESLLLFFCNLACKSIWIIKLCYILTHFDTELILRYLPYRQ